MPFSTSFDASVTPGETPEWSARKSGAMVALLLLLSFGVRIWLATTGGQDFWPDEARYSAGAREAAAQFAGGAPREAWIALIGKADHLFFKVAGVPMAWWELRHDRSPALVAVYFGVFSVFCLWLVYGLARRAGASGREAVLALFFAAGANSLFYYCRHFFPYDLALFFCLLALWIALGPSVWWASLAAGLAASFGFLSYNGYWLLAGVVLTWHVLSARHFRTGLWRAIWAATGLVIPIATAVGGAHWLGHDLIGSFRDFSGTITQGDFGRGHVFVWQYLWDTEGVLFVGWSGLALIGIWRLRAGEARSRWRLWIGAIVLLYLGLVICADGLRAFVIYGRTARMLVPFLCLAAATVGEEIFLSRSWPIWAWTSVVGGSALIAGAHMGRALHQVFPADFMVQAVHLARKMGTRPHGLLRILNAERLGEIQIMGEPRPHTVLFARPHPYEFKPYMYEGFLEAQRHLIQASPVSMQLIEVEQGGGGKAAGLPSTACRLLVRFAKNRTGVSEPLVTGGESQRANFIYVQYVDEKHVRFGFDVWGVEATLSRIVELNYEVEHELFLCGGLISQWEDGEKLQAPGDVLVVLDGEILLAGRRPANVVDRASIVAGMNLAGGSSAGTSFTGTILDLKWLEPIEVRPFLAERSLAGLREEPAWGGYAGPMRLKVETLLGTGPANVPLLTTGPEGAHDRIFLSRNARDELRVGFSHLAETPIYSDPVSKEELSDLAVVMGSCFPPSGITSPLGLYPAWRANQLVVLAGERLVLRRNGLLQPTDPSAVILGGNAMEPDGRASHRPGVWLQAEKIKAESLPSSVAQLMLDLPRNLSAWKGYPGAVRLRVRFGSRRVGLNEPLLVTGVTGAGDFIFVRHLSEGRIVVGHDHWGTGGLLSEALSVDDRPVHEIIISLPALFPSDDAAACYQQEPRWRKLRDQCVVLLDGKVLLTGAMTAHPALSSQIYAGLNPIGGSSTERFFSGEILSIDQASLENLKPLLEAP